MATQRFYDGQPGPDIRRELNNFEAILDGTVAAAQDASTAATSASVKAQQWADAAPGVEVETGKYSAKHWAAIAASTANDIHEAAAKITPADADELGLSDSAASWGLKKLTFANLKAWLAGLFVSKSGDTMTGPLTVEGENYADIMIRAYGNSGDGAVFHGNQALGTKAAPLPPSAGTPIFGIGARPWTGTQWAAHSTAAIHMFARENVSNTAQGTSFRIAVTPLGSNWEQRIHAVAFECDGVGQGARWRAKFSGTPLGARSYFQDNTGNATTLGVLSGADSRGASSLNLFSGTDPAASRYLQLSNNTTIATARIISGSSVDGLIAAYPLRIEVEGCATLVLETSGAVTSRVGPIGYGPGAGGSVTQATSKSTAVTLNKPCGQITMHNAALAAGASVAFQLNNNLITTVDTLILTIDSYSIIDIPTEKYSVSGSVLTTAAYITVKNISAGSLSEALRINFTIIKGATS